MPKPKLPPATEIKRPSKQTLNKYGLSLEEWEAILDRQGGVCSICQRIPPSGILCVDHFHAKGWKKMKPELRKLYVRTLACHFCNRRLLAKGITTERALNVYKVLRDFDQRIAPANDNGKLQLVPWPANDPKPSAETLARLGFPAPVCSCPTPDSFWVDCPVHGWLP